MPIQKTHFAHKNTPTKFGIERNMSGIFFCILKCESLRRAFPSFEFSDIESPRTF